METLRKEGLSLSDDQEKLLSQLEENIIKKEILPVVTEKIAPALKQVQRELVLVVDYIPNTPISVALSRKTKISEIMGAKTLTPHISTPVKSETTPDDVEPHEPTKHVENTTKGLRVIFPDGTIVWHQQAIDTFIDTIRKIGLERIAGIGIKHGHGYDLVGKEKRKPKPGCIWQHECDGWYIYSNISNAKKIADLQYISDKLHLNLIIEEGKPNKDKQYTPPQLRKHYSLDNSSNSLKEQFFNYLTNQKARSTANNYSRTLDYSVREWIREKVDKNADSVFSYTTSEDVRICIEMLNESPDFVAENERKHRSMSAALAQYLLFIEEREKK